MLEVILIAAPLLIIPLGLWHLDREGVAGTGLTRNGLLNLSCWSSGIMLAISLLLPSGTWAGLLALPWLLFTWALAVIGLRHFFRRVRSLDEQLCYSAALLFVAIGGCWAMISRAGLQPMEFSDTIVLLTGVHFHYAGFALPLLTGLTIRTLTRHHVVRIMVLLIISGIPLVGIGIAYSPLLELIAVGILATGCALLAGMQLELALRSRTEPARSLLLISSISLLAGMMLAVIYGIGEYRQLRLLEIPLMIPLHGIANSIGFSLAGLYGWRCLRPAAIPRRY
jgi:hypothetical protein